MHGEWDRRGHGGSANSTGQGSRRDDEDDLAALIELLDIAPAHVVANSFGASIALGLVSRRAHLFRSLCAHEPPLLSLVADDPAADGLRAVFSTINERLAAALGTARVTRLPAAGHGPHLTNAAAYSAEIRGFLTSRGCAA